MAKKIEARKKTSTKRTSKPAVKPKANGTADPAKAVEEFAAKLRAQGYTVATGGPAPERDPHRTLDGQLLPDHEAEQKVLAVEADPPTDDVHYQPIGDLVSRVLCAGMVTYEPTHPAHWTTLEGGLLRVTELELRALAIALDSADGALAAGTEATFDADDAVAMLIALSHRLDAGRELAQRLREARWGDPRFGGYDLAKAKRAAGETETEDAATESEAAS